MADPKAELLAALTAALAIENIPASEHSSYGDYLCHECGSRCIEPTGSCVGSDCWVEAAGMLRRQLAGRT